MAPATESCVCDDDQQIWSWEDQAYVDCPYCGAPKLREEEE